MNYGKFDNLVNMSEEIKVVNLSTGEVYFEGPSGRITDGIFNNIKKYKVKRIETTIAEDSQTSVLFIFVNN